MTENMSLINDERQNLYVIVGSKSHISNFIFVSFFTVFKILLLAVLYVIIETESLAFVYFKI